VRERKKKKQKKDAEIERLAYGKVNEKKVSVQV